MRIASVGPEISSAKVKSPPGRRRRQSKADWCSSIGLGSAAGALRLLQLGDLRARRVDQLRVGVSPPSQAPSAFDRFGKEDPRPRSKRGIAGCSRDQVGELADHGKLLLSVERACIGEYLHPDVVVVSLDVGE